MLSACPSPILAVYGAKDESSASARLAQLLESSQRANRLKTLPLVRDHALPHKKTNSTNSTGSSSSSYASVILKPDWTKKHQQDVPGAVLVCCEVDDAPTAAVPAGLSLLESVRSNLGASGRATLPVFLCLVVVVKPGAVAVEEERAQVLAQLKRQSTAQPGAVRFGATTAGFAVLYAHHDLVGASTGGAAVQRLGAEIMSAVLEHYHVEIGRIKAKQQQLTNLPRARARLEFKCAQLYEMRSLPGKALSHYQQAYQALSLLLLPATDESVLAASELVHYRMAHIRLAAHEPKMALVQLRTHLQAMSACELRPWEWLSRQHVLFAGLLASFPHSFSSSVVVVTGAPPPPQQHAIALASLDAVERERMTPAYHFSRAAVFAARAPHPSSSKQQQQQQPQRALELFEKLHAAGLEQRPAAATRTIAVTKRRQAVLLHYIAKERAKLAGGDGGGAGRDFARAAVPCRGDGWLRLVCRLHELAGGNTADDASALALYGKSEDARRRALASLVQQKLDKPCWQLMNAYGDGKRVLLATLSSSAAMTVVACNGVPLESGSFSNGQLLLTVGAAASDVVKLTMSSAGGGEWTVAVQPVSPKQLDNMLPIAAYAAASSTASASAPPVSLEVRGAPPVAFLGEHFTLQLSTTNDDTDDAARRFTCQSDSLVVTAAAAGQFAVAVPPRLPHKAVLVCAVVSSTVVRRIELDVVPALHVVSSRSPPQPHNNNKFIEVECNAHAAVTCIASSCDDDGLLGEWQPGERRCVLLRAASSSPITLELRRAAATGSVSFSHELLVPPPPSPPSVHDSNLSYHLSFSNPSPFVLLGQEIEMRLQVTTMTTAASAPMQIRISTSSSSMARETTTTHQEAEENDDFAVCGALHQHVGLALPGQRLEFTWQLVTHTPGPCRLPSVFVEHGTKQQHQQHVHEVVAADRHCMVIVA